MHNWKSSLRHEGLGSLVFKTVLLSTDVICFDLPISDSTPSIFLPALAVERNILTLALQFHIFYHGLVT